jgi:glycosyltransferase involved in cell wall biosynthesis
MTDNESSEQTPEFSLIVTTKDRTRELADLLRSLDRQRFRSFELIVSDQNADDRLVPVLAPFRQQFPLRHIRSAGGASRGRNAGLPLARGRYAGFPDDDCWYPPDLLAIVSRVFRDHPGWDIVCGRSVDADMRDTQGRWFADVTRANRRNVLRIGIEYTIFARSSALAAAGPFDEALGVGAGTPWGSGEATDFLLSAVEARQTVIYTPEIYVHHPEKVADYSRRARDRHFAYARGFGRVLGKHGYSLLEAFHHFARPRAGSVFFLARAQPERSLSHLRVFAGRSLGWLD